MIPSVEQINEVQSKDWKTHLAVVQVLPEHRWSTFLFLLSTYLWWKSDSKILNLKTLSAIGIFLYSTILGVEDLKSRPGVGEDALDH